MAAKCLTRDEGRAVVQLLLTYFRTSRAYHVHEFARATLRPKKDAAVRAKHAQRMLALGEEMARLADKIEQALE
jgi:hypothetical protein